jgi:GTP pyrophosphokinase
LKNFSQDEVDWYIDNRQIYVEFKDKLEKLIRDILEAERIDYHKLEARAKTALSFQSKLAKGVSYEPKKMNDLIGIRIIGFLLSDVEKISQCITDNFTIKPVSDSNKEELEVDKVGYKSKHFVCILSTSREKLSEFEKFSGIQFEIQVRTILQHAWAEINHDRHYKFSGGLPKDIRRSFNLVAGNLEIMDNEFERISRLVESYSNAVSIKTRSGSLNIAINTASLKKYLAEKIRSHLIIPNFGDIDVSTNVIRELKAMNIDTLHQLDEMLSDVFVEKYTQLLDKFRHKSSYAGLLRAAMISTDADMYFTKAWNKNYLISARLVSILESLGVDPTKIKFFSNGIQSK